MKIHITNVSGLAGAAGSAQQMVTDIFWANPDATLA